MPRHLERLPDWVWPHFCDPPEGFPADEKLPPNVDSATFELLESALGGRASSADDRGRALDAKLISLLTLSTILSAALVAAAAATTGAASRLPAVLLFPLLADVGYMFFQMLAALYWVLSGMQLRAYRGLSRADLTPVSGEPVLTYKRRIAERRLNDVWFNEVVNAHKADDLSLALLAYRNTVRGAFALVVLGAAMFVTAAWGSPFHAAFQSLKAEVAGRLVQLRQNLAWLAAAAAGLTVFGSYFMHFCFWLRNNR